MSNPSFVRVIPYYEPETLTFIKEILYDKSLSGNALKLLLIMLDYGNRPNWELRQTHLMNESGFGYEKYDNAIKNLISSGYVIRHREKKEGRFAEYQYQYSSFPIFLENVSENENSHSEKPPIRVSRTGKLNPEKPNLTYSNNIRLSKTTNYPKDVKPQVPKNLVSSSFEPDKLQELEDIPKLSESQKATLYKKFSHDQIRAALKSIDLSKARSVFAMLYKSLEEGWTARETKSEKHKEAINIFNKAEEHLSNSGSMPFSITRDKKNAYMHIGNGVTTYSFDSDSFKEDFCRDLNKQLKEFKAKK